MAGLEADQVRSHGGSRRSARHRSAHLIDLYLNLGRRACHRRPGAGGNIAAAIVAKAAPDGHALLVTGPNQAVNPTLLPNPGFDYERDLTPVSMVVQTKMLLVASPGFPGNDIADIIRLAKEKPKSLSIAISAIGTPNHLGAEMLTQFGNIDLVFVPYDGISQAIPI